MSKENPSAGILSSEVAGQFALLETLDEESADFETRRNGIRRKIGEALSQISGKKRAKVLRLAEDQRKRERRLNEPTAAFPLLMRLKMRRAVGEATYTNLRS